MSQILRFFTKVKGLIHNPVLFFLVLLTLLGGYFVSRSLSSKTIDIKPKSKSISVMDLSQKTELLAITPPKETNTSIETAESQKDIGVDSKKLKENKSVIYTVQVGAFKQISNARNLVTRLHKNGYEAFMILSDLKNEKKLFKVRAGAFRERKKAETLSEIIRKNEGIQTFVTFK